MHVGIYLIVEHGLHVLNYFVVHVDIAKHRNFQDVSKTIITWKRPGFLPYFYTFQNFQVSI